MNHIVVLEALRGPGLGLNGLIYLLFFENVGPWLLMFFFYPVQQRVLLCEWWPLGLDGHIYPVQGRALRMLPLRS